MPEILQRALPVIGATLGGYIAYVIGEQLSFRWLQPPASKRVKEMTGLVQRKKVSPTAIGSAEYKVRLAFSAYHLDVSGWETLALNLARLGLGTLLSLTLNIVFGLPPTASLAGLIGGLLIANSIAGAAWIRMQNEINREIPLFLSGFTSTIQVSPNVLQAVDEETNVLQKDSPLQRWLVQRFVKQGQERGAEAIQELVEEAFRISTSLGVMVFLIGRLWRTGGIEWKRSFAMAASNLEGVLEARILGLSAGQSAKNAVKVIIAVTLLIVLVLARNPVFQGAINNPLVQAVYAMTVIMMIFGYGFMGDMIDNLM